MDIILIKRKGKIMERSVEKIYAISSKRRRKNGEEYTYKNYEVFIPYSYLEIMDIDDVMYLYEYNEEIYLTGARPDGTVPAKKLVVHKQRGSSTSRKYKPDETFNNKWKRFFIVPKKFFPFASEENNVEFLLDPTEKEQFSQCPATLKMSLVDKED